MRILHAVLALATDFTLQSLAGDEVSLSDFTGRVVLINFFGFN